MEAIFEALHKSYVGIQIDGETHRLFLQECRTIIDSVRDRLNREQSAVTEGENALFADEVFRAQEMAREVAKDEETFFAELAAAQVELVRLEKTARANLEASGLHSGTLENLIAEWEQLKNGEFVQDQKGATDNERI